MKVWFDLIENLLESYEKSSLNKYSKWLLVKTIKPYDVVLANPTKTGFFIIKSGSFTFAVLFIFNDSSV